jgi:hypothetical protein
VIIPKLKIQIWGILENLNPVLKFVGLAVDSLCKSKYLRRMGGGEEEGWNEHTLTNKHRLKNKNNNRIDLCIIKQFFATPSSEVKSSTKRAKLDYVHFNL